MEQKYHTLDSTTKRKQTHPNLHNLLSFFESTSTSSDGLGSLRDKRPPVPPRSHNYNNSSTFDETSGLLDHNNNHPGLSRSTSSGGDPYALSMASFESLNSAQGLITDPNATRIIDELKRELQHERNSHLQTRHLLRNVEEDNRLQKQNLQALRAKYDRLHHKLQKMSSLYQSFHKTISDAMQDGGEFDVGSGAAGHSSTSPAVAFSNGGSPRPIAMVSASTSGSSAFTPSMQSPVLQPSPSFSGSGSSPHMRSKSYSISDTLSRSNKAARGMSLVGSGSGGSDLNTSTSGTYTTMPTHTATAGSPTNSNNLTQQHSLNYIQDLDDYHHHALTDDEYARMIENRILIVNQILRTEKEYAAYLQLIVEEFLTPMKSESYQSSNPFVTTLHIKQIFGDVEVILGSSGLLIEDIENVLNSDSSKSSMGSVFLKICDYFKLYSPYVKNYYTSISVLNKLKEESHKFQSFIHEKEQKLAQTNFTELGSLLVLPLSRIGQYTPLLIELFKSTPKTHDDYEPLKNAVIKMRTIVDYVKEKSREYESQNKVRIIQGLLIGKFQNLNEPHRRYVREGELTEHTKSGGTGNQLYCFLFNDLFIVSVPTAKKQQTQYTFKRDIRLMDAEVSVVSSMEAGDDKPLFQLSFTSAVLSTSADHSSSSGAALTANSVLNGIISGATLMTSSSESKVDGEQRIETLTFCADSARDRDEWVQALQLHILAEKKKNANRRTEEPTTLMENKGGDIDFKNSEIQLCEQIGSGGSGCTVHRCTVDGFTCAVKILKLKNTQPYLIDQFVSEINIMEQLSHSNIAKYLGHRLTANPERLWLFMEFYPYSLKDIIGKRSTPFPAAETIWMALEIAKGLEFLHNQKQPIIHRDLKPGNIMCSLDEANRVSNVRVCDFDTSKVMNSGVILKTCIGTPCYMAPEVLDVSVDSGSDGYSLKADIWSFSMLVFEILTLQPPYHQFPHLQTVEMILKGTPPPLVTPVSPSLSGLLDLLHQCIDLSPSKRPSSSQVVSKLIKLMKSIGKLQE
ncbi:hypothetical protein SAMD00019534_047580 [Acytostelium subglobosum LB1]|uniref:hypothetical protein n=1 Tax=Acytostelium subglobosum LB1 TaxID=1410327 RepID=UPI00064506C0|nr:hypothetical protein SAMD00019534_047580 [Acytostelium subglobosum LB1]GAM21583.1 hypothetical protein SAMD00019534_047580 [Acytostelium subglobosum LB1]|eukprot:XP_012755702.1 hypothetical protein SAMD00019534_047580 [Acytostelium subglobosum LB1]